MGQLVGANQQHASLHGRELIYGTIEQGTEAGFKLGGIGDDAIEQPREVRLIGLVLALELSQVHAYLLRTLLGKQPLVQPLQGQLARLMPCVFHS